MPYEQNQARLIISHLKNLKQGGWTWTEQQHKTQCLFQLRDILPRCGGSSEEEVPDYDNDYNNYHKTGSELHSSDLAVKDWLRVKKGDWVGSLGISVVQDNAKMLEARRSSWLPVFLDGVHQPGIVAVVCTYFATSWSKLVHKSFTVWLKSDVQKFLWQMARC